MVDHQRKGFLGSILIYIKADFAAGSFRRSALIG